MDRKSCNSRGSLTVEACVSFPVFLCFFMLLLFFVKLACINLILDLAVSETAKQIAASAYPIAIVNSLEDEIIEKYGKAQIPKPQDELAKLPVYAGIGNSSSELTDLLTGNLQRPDLKGFIMSAVKDYEDGIIGYIVNTAAQDYWNYKASAKYTMAKLLMEDIISEGIIDETDLSFRLVEFPQGDAEYAARSGYYEQLGFNRDGTEDITKDDVVIQLEYKFDIPIPFFGRKDIRLVHTAVERAWLKGSNGIITQRQEGLDIPEPNSSKTVYVTRTGKRYHLGNCRYLRKSKIAMKLEEAKKKYTPCKVCRPPIN